MKVILHDVLGKYISDGNLIRIIISRKAPSIIISGANNRVISIPHTQEHPDLQDIFTIDHLTQEY